MINEGNVRRAQHFLNVVKDTIDTSMCTVAIANSNINSEQSSTAAKATRAIAVADQRHLKKQGNVDPEKLHLAKCRAYNTDNKENVLPLPPKHKGLDTNGDRSPHKLRRKSLIAPRPSFERPSIDSAALRYHGPDLLPETLKGTLEKPPPPLNNSEYSPNEAMSILGSIQLATERKSQSARAVLRKHWIEKNLVPVKDSELP
jgi:hypothetical protein